MIHVHIDKIHIKTTHALTAHQAQQLGVRLGELLSEHQYNTNSIETISVRVTTPSQQSVEALAQSIYRAISQHVG